MKCPYCKADDQNKVVDSRSNRESDAIRRRRECENCHKRFTTYEYIERAEIVVVKRDRRREDFSADKLRKGINIACTKRPISIDDVENLIEKIIKNAESSGKTEIESREIGTMVMDELYALDQIAYIRFASVYRDFKTAEEFVKQITTLVQ
ncbi:MAG: transcriptional regulator NrdR [Chitinivibrionia bacterium]|jgi:transcriptional repressor NrdR|nr:transcriptional regulator NrdR [Chitinivibrionia bacterium]